MVQSHGPINRDALQFLSEVGRRLVETIGDVRASFLFQWISIAVQRFNSVLLHGIFIDDDRPEYGPLPNAFLHLVVIFELPGGFPWFKK